MVFPGLLGRKRGGKHKWAEGKRKKLASGATTILDFAWELWDRMAYDRPDLLESQKLERFVILCLKAFTRWAGLGGTVVGAVEGAGAASGTSAGSSAGTNAGGIKAAKTGADVVGGGTGAGAQLPGLADDDVMGDFVDDEAKDGMIGAEMEDKDEVDEEIEKAVGEVRAAAGGQLDLQKVFGDESVMTVKKFKDLAKKALASGKRSDGTVDVGEVVGRLLGSVQGAADSSSFMFSFRSKAVLAIRGYLRSQGEKELDDLADFVEEFYESTDVPFEVDDGGNPKSATALNDMFAAMGDVGRGGAGSWGSFIQIKIFILPCSYRI